MMSTCDDRCDVGGVDLRSRLRNVRFEKPWDCKDGSIKAHRDGLDGLTGCSAMMLMFCSC